MKDISIIIPVYKDTKNLLKLLTQLPKNLEIIVASNDEEFLRLKPVIKKHKFKVKLISAKKGRDNQMNAAAKLAKGKFLWFLHADSNLKNINFNNLFDFIRSQKDDFFMSLRVRFDSNKWFFKYIEFTSYIRQKYGCMPFGDQSLILSKSLFLSAGLFHGPFEDFNLSKKLRNMKIKCLVADQYIITSPRRFLRHGVIFTQVIMSGIIISHSLGLKSLSQKLYQLIK